MIANLLNTILGLVLAYVTVLHPHWIEHQYWPLLGFAGGFLVLALWARRSDPQRWFSTVNIALALALGIMSLFPLEAMPNLTFWANFWAGSLVPTISLWAALLGRDVRRGLIEKEHQP